MPSTLFVNVESRLETQKVYSRSFNHQLVFPIDFNSTTDTLFIPDCDTLMSFGRSCHTVLSHKISYQSKNTVSLQKT
jgi:hypothetical protein